VIRGLAKGGDGKRHQSLAEAWPRRPAPHPQLFIGHRDIHLETNCARAEARCWQFAAEMVA